MSVSPAAINKLLILGESNSIYANGWVAGLTNQTQEHIEIINSSLGSSGIFNAIYKLIRLGESIASFQVVLLDTCIQDASFYRHRTADYFELLGALIDYLQSRSITVAYLQFEKLNKEVLEPEFYAELRQFLESREVIFWNVNALILKHSDIKTTAELHFAYADPHHIKPEVAFHVGKIVGHELKAYLDNLAQDSSPPRPQQELPFELISAELFQSSQHSSLGQIETSLFQAKTLLISEQALELPVPRHLQGHDIVGLLFNANNANGVLQLASKNTLLKNLSNNSKQYWKSPLVWSRPLHQAVTLGKTLTLKAEKRSPHMEHTEYCDSHCLDENAPLCLEIIGLITRFKPSEKLPPNVQQDLNQKSKSKVASLFAKSQFKEATQFVEQFLPTHQGSSFLWKAYGAALLQTARAEEAISALLKSVALCADDIEAHNALAVAYQQCRNFDAAEHHFLRAIALSPNYFEAIFNFAEMYFERQRYDQAIPYFDHALRIKSDFIDALMKRGIALYHQGKCDDAEQDFSQVIKLNPRSHEAHCNLGNVLRSSQRVAEAEQHYLRAIELDATFVEAHSNLSHLQSETQRYQAAFESSKMAVQLNPQHLGALSNMALAQRGLGHIAEAILTLRNALKIKPDYDEGQINLAYMLLSLGQFEEGWRLHESRLSNTKNAGLARHFTQSCPQWQGQSITGRTLLIIPEQGLGDQIQFVRYCSLLQEMGVAKIYLICIEPLAELFSFLKNDRLTLLTETQTVPPCDYHVFMLSLPYLCQTRFETIPNRVPYLSADTQLSQEMQQRLCGITDMKVGLCWFGSSKYKYDAERSLQLTSLQALNTLTGVRYFNLQRDARLSFLHLFHEQAHDFGHEIDAHTSAFQETAALIVNLDLVITCDTAIGHLAGALGKPVWLLQPFVADWRWMNEGETTPWYPHTRLFRQNSTRSWEAVIARVCTELQSASDQHRLNSSTNLSTTPVSATSILSIPISLGEFFDKISILEIKRQRISDTQKLKSINSELNQLAACVPQELSDHQELTSLRRNLKQINEELWEIEDQLRQIETTDRFDETFIELARSVYKKNDLRAQLKYTINTLTNSTLREEKSYPTSPANNTQQLPAIR